jgi:hypothetical protein
MLNEESAENLLNKVFEQGRKSPKAIELPNRDSAIVIRDHDGSDKVHVFPYKEPDLQRIHQSVTLHDAESFIAYVNRFKLSETKIFAEPGFISGGMPKMVAVIDYHEG